jgi:hypothetical protein
MLKIRQPDGRIPKYVEAHRDRPSLFPGPEVIKPGRALVVCEGEFDALLLGQTLGDMAAVATLGSSAIQPDALVLARRMMRAAPRWYLAHDADCSGNRAASDWPDRAVRVRPPRPYKDWTEAAVGGVDLRRWWRDRLAGIENPELFTWEELSAWRWSDAIGNPEPGIITDKPDRGRMLAALKARVDDPEERKAIQGFG